MKRNTIILIVVVGVAVAATVAVIWFVKRKREHYAGCGCSSCSHKVCGAEYAYHGIPVPRHPVYRMNPHHRAIPVDEGEPALEDYGQPLTEECMTQPANANSNYYSPCGCGK